MQVKRIGRLQNFGVFRDYSWDNKIPDFKRFNLIYGWNRSGKTTLSRVFSSCEKKSTIFKQYPLNGEFNLITNNKNLIKNTNCDNCRLSIKVFNKDFIDENVSFDPSSSSKSIIYVGEEDIESAKKLNGLREKLENFIDRFEKARTNKTKCEVTEENFRISTANTVKTTVGDMKIRDRYYDYDKTTLKTTIDEVGIDNFIKLKNGDFFKYKKTINSETNQSQNFFNAYDINFHVNGARISSITGVFQNIKQILNRIVIAETIEKLRNDSELNVWTQKGLELHRNREEKEKCLFCQNYLRKDFLSLLSKHFSKDYENLQKDINGFVQNLGYLRKQKIIENNDKLYSDLQNDYRKKSKNLNKTIEALNNWIDNAVERLQEKFRNPLVSVKPPEDPKDLEASHNKTVKILNDIIKINNVRIVNHDKEVNSAKKNLEKHIIAVSIEKQNYKQIKEDLNLSIKTENEAKSILDETNQNIATLESSTSNIGKALQKLNKHLEEFFGRKEIQLELDNARKGYIIKREGNIADNLSESEKSAVAFSYFLVKTEEKGFKINNGIIFIDDPISSFDSNFIYHCFSLIKNHFNDAEQLFISTHNFELFSLVKDWLLHKKKKDELCEFYMIENIVKNDKRYASIKQLEKTLRNFKSEYHFLFTRLIQFVDNEYLEYADFYVIGNIARRVLEIFVNFKIPTTGDFASKIAQLDTSSVSNIEKDKVYKLIQEFSHGFDPSSMIEHKDRSESREAIKVLMKIIQESDPKHFESLKRVSNS